MADVKLSSFSNIPSLNSMALFVGLLNNGDGTYENYTFTPAQMINYIAANTGLVITAGLGGYSIGGAGTTLTGSFFSNTISEIATNLQTYLVGADFTQSGSVITLLNGMIFNSGQILRAKL